MVSHMSSISDLPRFKLEDVKEALQALFAKERDGRILLDINNDIWSNQLWCHKEKRMTTLICLPFYFGILIKSQRFSEVTESKLPPY